MKTLRWFTFVFLVVLLVVTVLPASVSAASQDSDSATTSYTVDLAKTKLAKVKVTNKTGGTMTVRLTGPRTYYFSVPQQGKWTSAAIIEPGKYTITVTTSACGGSYVKTKNVKGGTVGIPVLVCR